MPGRASGTHACGPTVWNDLALGRIRRHHGRVLFKARSSMAVQLDEAQKHIEVSVFSTLSTSSPNPSQGELDQASRLCNEVLQLAPKNAKAYFLRGAIEQRNGNASEAARCACEAALLRPDLPALKLVAGSLLMQKKAYAEALALYEAAIELDPDNAKCHAGGERQ